MYLNYITSAINLFKNSNVYNNNKMENNLEIISKLKFIGRLKKGEKINTQYMYVQPQGMVTTLSRTFVYQDNRGNALNFCNETISRAFELLVTYERDKSEEGKVTYTNLINDLREAQKGLLNLKTTYLCDTKLCCDVDIMIENIDKKLDTLPLDYIEIKEESKQITNETNLENTTSKAETKDHKFY